MIRKGHRIFTVVLPPTNTWTSRHRLEALIHTGKRFGFKKEQLRIIPPKLGLSTLDESIRNSGSTRLVNFDSGVTLPLLDDVFNESPLRVPEDPGLLTVDNTSLCTRYHPRISRIVQPLRKIAKKAIETLVVQPQDERMNRNTLYSSRPEPRGSAPDRS